MNKFRFYTKLIQLVFNVLTWISTVFHGGNGSWSRAQGWIQPLLHKMDLILRSRGPLELIKWTKATRSALLNYLSGNPTKVPGVRCTTDGIPVVLGELIPQLRGKEVPVLQLQLLTTILWSTRALNAGRIPDITPITQPSSVVVPSDIGKYTRDFWRATGTWPSQKVPKHLNWKRFHFTTKSGPNGHALWTCLSDLISLPESLINSLKVVGGERFSRRITTLIKGIQADFFKGILPMEKGKIRKLSYFPDKEEKVRVIAVLDYWSQTVLQPLHSYLYRVLRRIPQDCTYDQGSFKERLKDCRIYYSIDLTNATDRFPIEVKALLLKGKLPEHYVNSWVDIMVGYPFHYTDNKKISQEISYARGDGMGAYSSWATFALANHYLVYYCCRELKKDWATLPYAILGDDIIIGDREVGELYIQMMGKLDVPISAIKTHKSEHFYEFAKRLIYKNIEITPFPISSLKESMHRYYQCVNLIMEVTKKGYVPNSLDVPSVVSQLYNFVRKLPSRMRRKIKDKAYISERILLVMRGKETASDAVNGIIRYFNYPFTEVPLQQCQGILESIAVELFAESNPENDKAYGRVGKPLGLMATELVMYLTSFMEDPEKGELGFNLIECLPHLGCYGQVEEMFIKLKKQAIRIDTTGGEWPLLLRAMTLPISDEVFSLRTSKMVPYASSVVGKKLKERLDMFRDEHIPFP